MTGCRARSRSTTSRSASSATGPGSRTGTGSGSTTSRWECDYPHSDSTWPHSPEAIAKQLEGVPDDEIAKITHENAMRIFRYDPFTERPREQCDGRRALRAEASD